jgi:hypothetical protein
VSFGWKVLFFLGLKIPFSGKTCKWLYFYYQILEYMSHEQILHLISILKNKELLKDEVSVSDFLRYIRSKMKMDITPQLKKLFKTLYLFEKFYTRFYYDLLEPDTFEDAILMIPKIKELLLSLDFDGDTNVNQLIGVNLSAKIFSLISEDTDLSLTVEYTDFLLTVLKSGSLMKSLRSILIQLIQIHFHKLVEFENFKAIKTMLLVSIRELFESNLQDTNRNIYLEAILSSLGVYEKISLSSKELKDYISMTIKLLKDSTEQEKPRVNMLPFIFEYHQDLIDNFMPEIGEILNLCIPEMGMIVGEGVDSILTVYNLANVLKNKVWPWKETIFNHCHKILIKNKLGDDETILTNSLSTISILIDLFEEKMEI